MYVYISLVRLAHVLVPFVLQLEDAHTVHHSHAYTYTLVSTYIYTYTDMLMVLILLAHTVFMSYASCKHVKIIQSVPESFQPFLRHFADAASR